jgi:hypothetical protein
MPPSPWPDGAPETLLAEGLTAWARQCPLPLVLFFDEIDALEADAITIEPRDFLLPSGRLDFSKLLDGFVAFWMLRRACPDRSTV